MSFLNDMRSISSMVGRELQEFTSEVGNTHMRWLDEIEQEASRMFSGEVSTEPDLMPKTPSQKRRARRKRVSIAQQEEQPRRTRRGKLSGAKLELVFEEEGQPQASTSSSDATLPDGALQTVLLDDSAANQSQPGTESTVVEKMVTQQPNQTQPEPFTTTTSPTSWRPPEVYVRLSASDRRSAETAIMRHRLLTTVPEPAAVTPPEPAAVAPPVTPPCTPEPVAVGLPKAVVEISTTDRRSAEMARRAPSHGHATTETEATAETGRVQRGVFLKLRNSLTGLKVRGRASRSSLLKQNNKKSVTRATLQRSICSEDIGLETDDEEEDQQEMESEPSAEATGPTEEPQEAEVRNLVTRASTRSAAASSTPQKTDLTAALSPVRRSRSSKRKAEEPAENTVPQKKSVMKPSVTAAKKNRTLMTPLGRTPVSVGRTAAMKGFINKHSTPLKNDLMAKELQKHEALQRKQQQEEERAKKLEEEKKQKQEERKRKLQERQRKAAEVRAEKEEKKEKERKRKIEEKKAQIDEKLRVQHLAEENEEERRQQALEAKRRADEAQETARQLEAERRALEEKERARQLEAERRALKEKERARQLEAERRALKEKERARQLETERRALEEQEIARQLEAERRAEEEEDERACMLEFKRRAEEKERARQLEAEVQEIVRQVEADTRAEEEEDERACMEFKRMAEEQRRAEEFQRAMELQAAALREEVEAEKALALQQEKEKRKVLEEQRRKEEQQRLAEAASTMQSSVMETKGTALNVTVDVESPLMKTPAGKGMMAAAGLNVTVDGEAVNPFQQQSPPPSYCVTSPQSYSITPKGGNKPVTLSSNQDDYGMDQNSDDSTDDESEPRKPIPSWAEGPQLQNKLLKEYFNPPDLHALFGPIEPPNLAEIFRTTKPRFNKRTSSAVWNSPPMGK